MKPPPESKMVDIGDKPVTRRQATAKGKVIMKPATFDALVSGTLPKGEALSVARIAGINAAKETPRLIPMCHPLLIDDVSIEFATEKKSSSIEITASVKGSGKTGFEMEAMTAVSVSALTIYDMCKALDSSIRIENIRLAKKSGGKSGKIILEE
jgi:cyclic pyranopterin phosphate synthase